jgi:hypothetical protein
LRETLDAMLEKHDVEFPLVDVIFVAMGGELQQNIHDAGEIGPSTVEGTPCQQVAFRDSKVDWQMWIEQGAKPVPRKLVITTTDAPTRPQYSAVMRWDVPSTLGDDLFQFTPPKGTLPITLGAPPSLEKPIKPSSGKPAQ